MRMQSQTRTPDHADPPSEECPGILLARDFMQPLELTAYRLAKELGVAPIAVSEVLRGKRSISAAMAARLGCYFGVDPRFWMDLQAKWDLARVTNNGNNGDVSLCSELKGRQFVLRQFSLGESLLSSYRAEIIPSREPSGNGQNGAKSTRRNNSPKVQASRSEAS